MSSAPAPLRIMIVDDHEVVRAGLRMLIDSEPGMEVVALASNRKESLAAATKESPDLILLDLDLGGENALTFITELKETAKNARILVLTGLNDSSTHRRAIKLGAMGVVLKDQAAEVLINAIRKVHSGEVWIDRAMVGDVLTEMVRGGQDPATLQIDSLTDRERQVIKLIAEGLRNKQIGERLYISETTVTHHLSSIFSKLGVSDRLELVIFAFGHNLARIPQPE